MDGQRTPLQDLETLYIGGMELAVMRRARVGQRRRLKFLRPGAALIHELRRTGRW
jgi:hypothetical protein